MNFLLFVFVFAFSDAFPGYSDSSSYSGNDIEHGSSGGSGYGYGGSFSGSGLPGGNFAFPAFPQFDFSGFFDSLNKQHQSFLQHGGGAFSFSYASSSPNSTAQAQSSISFDNSYGNGIQRLSQSQGAYAPGQGSYAPSPGGYGASAGGFADSSAGGQGGGYGLGNRGGFVGGYGGGFSGSDGNGFSFSGPIGPGSGAAVASGSIGPGGGHQTAAIYPENPNIPNVNTRFGGADSGGGGGGFKSVFTSSKSLTSGDGQTVRQASTTINDNGKVTTYTAHNP